MRKANWIKKYSGRLFGFIRQKVENEDDAWDIFQETLISAVESLPSFSSRSSFYTWLCGVALHEIADFYRKKKIKTLLFSHLPWWLENLASQALGPEQIFLRKEFEQKVKKTLASLSEGYAQVLRLKYYQDLTVAQIAHKLDETVKTVESRLFRARTAFAKAFVTDSSQGGVSPPG